MTWFILIFVGICVLFAWGSNEINKPPRILYYTDKQAVDGYTVFSSNPEYSNEALKVDSRKMIKNGTVFQRVSKEVWITMRGERIFWYIEDEI